jgi:hypothetical protein
MRRHLLLCLVPLLVACSSGGAVTTAASGSSSPEGAQLLFFASEAGVTAYDARSGQVTATVPNGLLSPDHSTVFSVSSTGTATVVDAHDPATGERRTTATVDGTLQLRASNHDGSAVVLAPPRDDAQVGYPAGRLTTTLTIAPTDGRPSRTLEVAGNLEPEAFSQDDSALFVLEYIPAEAPVGYQVRGVDLATGEVSNVRTDHTDLEKPMAGRARTQVLSPDGSHLYTLYVVADESQEGGGYAFVHVLDLVDEEAICVDLPRPFGMGAATDYAIAISRDGKEVFSVDPSHGALAVLDTEREAITRTVSIAPMEPGSVHAAVGDSDRLFVGAGHTLTSFEPNSLTVVHQATLDGPIAAVLTTSFDDAVYVAVDDTIAVFDGADIGTGPASSTVVPNAPGLVAAEPVPSVEARGPTGCAC